MNKNTFDLFSSYLEELINLAQDKMSGKIKDHDAEVKGIEIIKLMAENKDIMYGIYFPLSQIRKHDTGKELTFKDFVVNSMLAHVSAQMEYADLMTKN